MPLYLKIKLEILAVTDKAIMDQVMPHTHTHTMLIPFLFRQPVPGASCPGHTDPAVGSYCYNHLPECSSLNSPYIPL